MGTWKQYINPKKLLFLKQLKIVVSDIYVSCSKTKCKLQNFLISSNHNSVVSLTIYVHHNFYLTK